MGISIQTQVMVQKSTDIAKDSSYQMHRTDVSQQAYTKAERVKADRELHQAVAVENADGNIMIRDEEDSQGEKQRKAHNLNQKKKKKTDSNNIDSKVTTSASGESTFDVRI